METKGANPEQNPSPPDMRVRQQIYLEGKLRGLEEAISSVQLTMGTINGDKPRSIIEKQRRDCFKKLIDLADKVA